MPREKRHSWSPTTAEQPLQWHNIPRAGQRAVQREMQAIGQEFPEQARRKAAQLQRQSDQGGSSAQSYRSKADRLESAAEDFAPGPVTIRQAAQTRADRYEDAASDRRLSDEGVAGSQWFFEHHREVRDIGREVDPDIPTENLLAAGSEMSAGTTPEEERKAIREVAQKGSTARIMGRGATSRAEKVVSGEVPWEEAQNPAKDPKQYGYTRASVSAVPGSEIETEIEARNTHLGRVIRGEENPRQGTLALFGETSPRSWASDDAMASPSERASAQAWTRHREQEARYEAGYDVPREVRSPQPLDPMGHTPEDTWEMSMTTSDHFSVPAYEKSAGDLDPFTKQQDAPPDPETGEVPTTKTGKRQQVYKPGMEKAPGSPAALRHAWENEATRQAGKELQSRHQTDFEVTPGMVQPVAWTAQKRRVPTLKSPTAHQPGAVADPGGGGPASTDTAYNRARKESVKQDRAEKREAREAERVVARGLGQRRG